MVKVLFCAPKGGGYSKTYWGKPGLSLQQALPDYINATINRTERNSYIPFGKSTGWDVCISFRLFGGNYRCTFIPSKKETRKYEKRTGYCKYFLSVVLEAVTMALAIVACNAFINAGLPSFSGDYADWAKTLIYLCEMTFTIAMTVGSVKGAQSLTSRALGL